MGLTPGAVVNESGSLTNPRFIRTALRGSTTEANGTTKPMINVLDWYVQVPLPGGTLATFIANLMGFIQVDYLGCMSSTYNLDDVSAKYLDNPLNIPTISVIGAPGSIATDRAASFTAGTIQKLTTVPSRNFRGAMHIGALPEAFTTTDHLNATGIAAYTSLDADLTGLVTSGVSDGAAVAYPIIISQTLSDLFASPAVFTYAPITSFFTNTRIGTMRRRKERPAF